MNLDSVLKIVQGWIKVKGDSDSTLIGNVGDRLKVQSQGAPLPDENIIISGAYFKKSGSMDMNVNGSSTPQVFTIGPTTTDELWFVTRFSVSLVDNGSPAYDEFGAISHGLTNGVLIEIFKDSVAYPVTLMKNNDELIAGLESRFRGQSFSFINDSGYINANTKIDIPIRLSETTGDQMRITIQDNLTGLNYFRARVFYRRVL